MSGKYQAYPEYQESGEEWLGKVPSHWDVIQIKHLSVVKRGASPRPIDDPKYFDDEGEYVWTRIADVTASDVYLTKAPQRLSVLGSLLSVKLEPESLFLSIAGTVGKPCITGMKACIHDGFVYFPELKIPSKFLFYVFAGEQAYKGLGKFGTQLNLNTDTVGGIKIGCTENEELGSIVNFLDHETAKIDTLIEKQKQLIALLKEKRQAVISHAVTNGLNPDAPMRDSGVEWLGEVPEHWAVARFKHLVAESAAGPFGASLTKSMYTSSGIKVYGQQQVIPDDLSTGDYYISEAKFEGMRRYEVFPNDILISVMGTVGKVSVAPQNIARGIINPRLVKYKVMEDKVLPHFVKASILSDVSQSQLLFAAKGSTMDGLNMQIIGELPIPYPPTLVEQKEILSEVKRQGDKFDSLLSNAQVAVGLLSERRIALISAAVTGKIDVRNWQGPSVIENVDEAK